MNLCARWIVILSFLLRVVLPSGGASLPFAGLDDLRGPYEGTGITGEAFHVQPLGMAGELPVCAFWSSGRRVRSPLLGFGWSIPVLESRFVQLDERRWAFFQPDGYTRIFVNATKDDDSVLTGGPAWGAVLKGDSIRVTADPHDGGPKSEFTFRQGRLVRMVCEEGDFEIKYTGREADRIVSRGKTLLEVVKEKSPVERILFRFNGGRSQVAAICRPATVFGMQEESAAMMTSQENCLAILETPSGNLKFEYGGERGEAFFTAGDKRWTWDARTRKITSCGEWMYNIGEIADGAEEPPFTRRKADGTHESYSYDRKKGLLTQFFTNGVSRVRKVFTSGPLAYRRIRWTKETAANGDSVRSDFTYNEAGRVVYRRVTREGEHGGTEEVWLGDSGKVIRRRIDGKEVTDK